MRKNMQMQAHEIKLWQGKQALMTDKRITIMAKKYLSVLSYSSAIRKIYCIALM